jgi:hypothetical protein
MHSGVSDSVDGNTWPHVIAWRHAQVIVFVAIDCIYGLRLVTHGGDRQAIRGVTIDAIRVCGCDVWFDKLAAHVDPYRPSRLAPIAYLDPMLCIRQPK